MCLVLSFYCARSLGHGLLQGFILDGETDIRPNQPTKTLTNVMTKTDTLHYSSRQ